MQKPLLVIKISVSCELKHFSRGWSPSNITRSLQAAVFRDCAREFPDSLLQWLESCKDSLQVVEAICVRGCMEGLLELAATSCCMFRIVDIWAVSNISVQPMAQCRLLTTCRPQCLPI